MSDILTLGEMSIEGRLRGSSNAALLVVCERGGASQRAVYKPQRGERPLWDFPTGTLGRREVATSIMDAALGWDLVPTTVWRPDAPMGPGSVQVWVDAVEDDLPVDVVEATAVAPGWLTVAEGEGTYGDHVCLVHEDSAALMRLAVLDAVTNNADRKGGHVLRDSRGRIAGIDHGLTFHVDDKMRTVLWGWAGAAIPGALLADLEALSAGWERVADDLADMLSRAEIAAAKDRLDGIRDSGSFPEPFGPWPALPWPAM